MGYVIVQYSCSTCQLQTGRLKEGDCFYILVCRKCQMPVSVEPIPFSFAPVSCPQCGSDFRWADSSEVGGVCPRCQKATLRQQMLRHCSTGYLVLPKVGQLVCGFYTGRGTGEDVKAFMKEVGIEPLVPEDPRGRMHLIACGAEGRLAEPAPDLPQGTPIECEVLSTGEKYVEIVVRFVRQVSLQDY
jgi:hypothetical protein